MYKWFVKNLKKDNRGFTLIELIVVIGILGLLTMIAVPKYTSSKEEAAITVHNANVRTLESAANMYLANGMKGMTDDKVEWTASTNTGDSSWQNYLQEWPKVPSELKGKTFKEESDGTTDYKFADDEAYTVTIKTDGTIEVAPPRVIK